MKDKLGLSEKQIEKYSPQIILKEIGGNGMKKLLNSTIAVIGAGSLGCFAIQSLTAVGIGRLKVYDGDIIELSNIARQILYSPNDIGKYKVDCIVQKTQIMNPDIKVEGYKFFIDKNNISENLSDCNYIIDASDNFPTKFLINDFSISKKIPFVIAGVEKFNGQVISVIPGKTACYRCIFNEVPSIDPNRSCSSVGIIGTVPAITGNIQANEAIKSILGLDSNFTSHIFFFNLLKDAFHLIEVKKNSECIACSNPEENFYLYKEYGDFSNICNI